MYRVRNGQKYRPYCIIDSNNHPLNQPCPSIGHHSQNLDSTTGSFLDWLKGHASPPNENHGSWNKLAPRFVTFNKHTVPTITSCIRIFSFLPLQVPDTPPRNGFLLFSKVCSLLMRGEGVRRIRTKGAVEFHAGYRKPGRVCRGREGARGGDENVEDKGSSPLASSSPALTGRRGLVLTSQPAHQSLGPSHSGRLPIQREMAVQRVSAACGAGTRCTLVL